MIRMTGVRKFYWNRAGRNTVLDGVTAEFPPGARVGILGSNGAGKSTLLRLISGVEPPSDGVIERRGRISWPIGFNGALHPALSGRDNCRFVARLYGQDADEVNAFVSEFARIGRNMDEAVSTYSSGMKSRVSVGLSLSLPFDFYLIDEAFSVGDKDMRQRSKELFWSRARRAGIIIVSHKMDTVREYADRGMILTKGRLIELPTLEDAIAAYEEGRI